jgi:PleD family two-component response regulator
MAAVHFPYEPGQDVIARSFGGEFPAKVFSLVRRYGGEDFAVVVDAKGRTHHKLFSELRAA